MKNLGFAQSPPCRIELEKPMERSKFPSFSQFVEELKEQNPNGFRSKANPDYGHPLETIDKSSVFFGDTVTVSTVYRGSCWGSEEASIEQTGDHADMDVLLPLLEKYLPNLTYLQYRKMEKLFEHKEFEDGHDYYGNFSNVECLSVKVGPLYDFLKEIFEAK